MQLPFSVAFDPPRTGVLRRLGRAWWVAALALGLAAGVALVIFVFQDQPGASGEPASATIQVSSEPPGATVEVDGRGRGPTPLSLTVRPGVHRLTLRREDYAEAAYQVEASAGQTTKVAAELWLKAPQAQRLRPTFPGATIADATFLADGRVALTLTLPPGDERQLWAVDAAGNSQRLGPSSVQGSLVATSDGQRVAYLARKVTDTLSDGRLDEVWVVGADGENPQRRYQLPVTATDQRLIDLAWAPDGEHLILVSRGQVSGGAYRAHLLWLDLAKGQVRELASLPSEVVSGSFTWSPDGKEVAFLTRAGSATSLCLLGLETGEFRYLTDVSRDEASPLPFAPTSWSADGQQLAYAAPAQERAATNWLFGQKPPLAVFTVQAGRSQGTRLGQAEGQAPAWRDDGSLLVFARPKSDGPLALRTVDPTGQTTDVAQVPIRVPASYAARWDVGRAQAILAYRNTADLGSPGPEFWWVHFRPEVER